ncbi:MAG: TIGR03564 family F420-dependent LLM class oxidoreductase [Chloroflexi bacterium]|nr:TIGR03564 family F420-dependent LLM class oxidoreductase [Chloroflexota bacterium]MDA1147043.1 TIGR03564 family F420-dependent LLM class oxidoreductase [Chloroflexota bacterium]
MRIGLTGGAPGAARTVADAQRAEQEGFAAYALPGDSTAMLALIGAQTESIRLLTAVVPIFGIHPSVLANQARVAQDASNNRFTLGIGLSHPSFIEASLGISFDRPGSRMEEYLRILAPLLRGDAVDFAGEFYSYHGEPRPGPADAVSLGVAALGPRMLRMTGEQAQGTILWMGTAQAVESHVAPRIRRAAEAAGRPAPEIIAGLPIALTNDAAAAREQAAQQFAMYGTLPSYRALLDHGGAAGPGDAALVGNEAELDAELDRLEAAGVTLFNPAIFRAESGGPARTREYLADRARQRAT